MMQDSDSVSQIRMGASILGAPDEAALRAQAVEAAEREAEHRAVAILQARIKDITKPGKPTQPTE